MKFSIKITKKDLPRLIAALILAGLGIAFSLSAFYDAVIWFAGLFLLTFVTITVDGEAEGKKKLLRFIPEIILPVFASFFSVYFMQMINLAHHDTIAGIKWLYDQMYHLDMFRWVVESLIVIGVYFFFRTIQLPRRIAAAATPAPFLILGLANFYVFTFRGHELIFSDIFSWETAANVVGNYTFPILYPVMYVLVPYVLYIMCCLRIKEDKPVIKLVVARIAISAVLSAAFIFGFCYMIKIRSKDNRPQDWSDKGSRFNGFLMNFSTTVVTAIPEVPEGYSVQNLDAMIKDTGIDVSYPGAADDDSSNIIVIMNEGYSDFVMDAARSAGAGGGTVLHAKGTAGGRDQSFYGVNLAEEKDMVYIVAYADQKAAIMHAISEKAGPGTKAGAICFSLPISSVIGLRARESE